MYIFSYIIRDYNSSWTMQPGWYQNTCFEIAKFQKFLKVIVSYLYILIKGNNCIRLTVFLTNGYFYLALQLFDFLIAIAICLFVCLVSPSMTDTKEHTQKLTAGRAALETELITSGGQGVLLTDDRVAILQLTPSQLLKKLKDGNLTAVNTLEAYQAKVWRLRRKCGIPRQHVMFFFLNLVRLNAILFAIY